MTSEKKIVQTGLRLPKTQRDKIKAISDRTGATLNGTITRMIDDWLTCYEKNQPLSPRDLFHTPQDTV